MSKKFLHIGCGPLYKDNTTPAFNSDEWEEVRLDIDPAHNPDIVCSMTEMTSVDDNSFDAIYSSHNIEHIFPHEVVGTLQEFRRVLKDDGFLILTCPDIKAVCALIGEGKVGQKLYTAPAGDIFPLDVLYGHRVALASGHTYMAHKNGFTSESLSVQISSANFRSFCIGEMKTAFSLWLIAYKNIHKPTNELATELKSHLLYENETK